MFFSILVRVLKYIWKKVFCNDACVGEGYMYVAIVLVNGWWYVNISSVVFTLFASFTLGLLSIIVVYISNLLSYWECD